MTSDRGIINSFGAFEAYYKNEPLRGRSSSSISWIGTFQGFLLLFFGIVGGPLFDKGWYRLLISGGALLTVFGMMMTSLSTQYYELFLAQGVCVGLGTAVLFLPSVALTAQYFSTKRALATGIVASGGSVGAVIYTIIFRKLQPRIGFGWTTRIIGFIALACLAVSFCLMHSRQSSSGAVRKIVDLSAFKSTPFLVCISGFFLSFVGLYVPFFHIITYAQSHSHVNEDMSFYLLSIMNAGSVIGRIIPGAVADRVGSVRVMTICIFASAILMYAWIAIDSLASLVVFSVLYGCLSGAVVSLPPTMVASLVPGIQQIGTWMGMAFCFSGLGLLVGNPIAGTLISVQNDDFVRMIVFGASCTMAAGVIFGVLDWLEQQPHN